MSTYRLLAAALLLSSGTGLATKAVEAADFRVDNAVFIDGQSAPQSQGVTIFQGGLVYDFLNDPAEVIVFDKAHRRFVLLDMTRHVRSEISTGDITAFADRVKQRLAGHPDANVKWLGDPSFDESTDRGSSELVLKSASMAYRVQVQPTSADVAAQYHEFSDWYAQFNLAINPTVRPRTFPRMMLNDAIERCRGVAKEVHLATTPAAGETPIHVTSRHQLALQLDAADMNRVAEAREFMHSFTGVSFREYRQAK